MPSTSHIWTHWIITIHYYCYCCHYTTLSILQMRKLKPGEVKIFILGFTSGCGSTPKWCSNPRYQEGPSVCFCSCVLEYLLLLWAPWTFTLPHSLASPGTRSNPRHLSPEAHWFSRKQREVRFRAEIFFFIQEARAGEGGKRGDPVMAPLPSPHRVYF